MATDPRRNDWRNNLTDAEVAALLATWDEYAWRLAHRWKRTNPQLDLEELYAEVRYGFVEAARRWNPARGFKFPTYATWWGERRARDLVRRELARGMHVPGRHGLKALDVWDIEVRCRKGGDQVGTLAVAPEPDPQTELPPDFWARIERVLKPKEYTAIILRFREGLTLVAAGERMGVSRGRVQQLEAQARLRIAEKLPEMAEYLED